MIRNEVVTVFIGGSQVYPDNVRVTLGVGKGYNTCSMSGVGLGGAVGETISMTINADNFVFLLTERRYGEKDAVSINGKGVPFVLENQSQSDDTLDYTDSDTLIENERGAVIVVNNLPNISFGSQVYNKSNTPMGRILDMVSVVGGEAYEYNSSLYLEEIKTIDETPTIVHTFAENEFFNYDYSDNIEQSISLKQVLINPITDDIYVEPSINVQYNEDTKIAEVYFNPSLSLGEPYSFLGMIPRSPTNKTKTETILVSEETQLQTIGGIDTVLYMNLDGVPFTDYVVYPPYNVVRFTNAVDGEIEISYTTKNIVATVSKTTSFLIKYKCVKSEGTIEIDESNSVSSSNCRVTIETPLTWENGGAVTCYKDTDVTLIFIEKKGSSNIATVSSGTHSGGGALNIKYTYASGTWADTTFMNNITSSTASTIETTSGTIAYDEDLAEYVVFLPMKPLSVNSVLEGSVGLVGYTYVDAIVPYISFLASDVGRNVDISLTVDVVTITIPPPTSGHVVNFLDAVGCGGVATQEFINSADALCTIPSTFKVDVAEMFGVSIISTYGLIVVGDGGIGNLTIDEFGKVEVTITGSNLYTLDCGNVKPNAKITIDARGVV
jgi:hypothetical protein